MANDLIKMSLELEPVELFAGRKSPATLTTFIKDVKELKGLIKPALEKIIEQYSDAQNFENLDIAQAAKRNVKLIKEKNIVSEFDEKVVKQLVKKFFLVTKIDPIVIEIADDLLTTIMLFETTKYHFAHLLQISLEKAEQLLLEDESEDI